MQCCRLVNTILSSLSKRAYDKCVNRFERQEKADDTLRTLEFSDSIFEQEKAVADLVRFDMEFSFTRSQRAAFDVLLKEFNAKVDEVFRLKGDQEPGPHKPPFPLNDGELF